MTLTDLRTAAAAMTDMDNATAVVTELNKVIPMLPPADALTVQGVLAAATQRCADCKAKLVALGITVP